MVRFSQRESVLLGYSPQSQKSLFMNHHDQCKNPTRRNSDIDFSDVFGGPPRRASIQETRYSFNGSGTELRRASNDDQEDDGGGGGDINGSERERIRDRLSGPSEKPVFGDPEGGVNKRGYPSEDFFDDIFKGKDYPLSSSPRKHERDSFSAAPGSRVLSPVRPLPPRAEPLGSSSFPAHFSLPARLMKGTELPTFGSGNRNQHRSKDGGSNGASNYSYSPLSRFSSQANQVQEAFENNVKLHSFLSKELSLSSEESLDLGRPDDKCRNLDKWLSASDSDCPEVQGKSNQFHFSIYKWASKGAPLEMPLRGGKSLEEKSKVERSSSLNGWLNGEGMAERSPKVNQRNQDFSSFNSSLSSSAARFMKELDKQKDGSVADTSAWGGVEKPLTVEEANLPVPDSESLSSHQVVVEDGLVKTGSKHTKEETESHFLSEAALYERKVHRISVVLQEAPRTELKPLRSLFFDNDHEAVIDNVAKSDISKESKVKSTKKSAAVFDVCEDDKKKADHSINVASRDFDKANLTGSPKNLSSSIGKNKSGGKVKEFVKIFNLEAATKPELDVESQRLSFRRKEMGKPYTTAAARVTSATIDEKLHSPSRDKTSDASVLVDKYLKKSEKQQPETRPNSTNSMNCTSGPKAIPASTVGSVTDGMEATFGDLDESFHGNYLIEELPHDEEKPPQTGATCEEFQVINDKIRHWSRGKEGNIRSLLSTLQYILWPESGWKPVPLVDIIEGNAVKRSYQKALLCLHPDKMQQKAATSHQKYIAEKVFDILQEAWTHFSSLGSV